MGEQNRESTRGSEGNGPGFGHTPFEMPEVCPGVSSPGKVASPAWGPARGSGCVSVSVSKLLQVAEQGQNHDPSRSES